MLHIVHSVYYHLYTDDTQLYITFDLHDVPVMIKRRLKNGIVVIKQWMTKHFLCLNEDKTEVLVLGSEYYIPKLSIPTVVIGNEQLVPGNKLEILASILTQPSIS